MAAESRSRGRAGIWNLELGATGPEFRAGDDRAAEFKRNSELRGPENWNSQTGRRNSWVEAGHAGGDWAGIQSWGPGGQNSGLGTTGPQNSREILS